MIRWRILVCFQLRLLTPKMETNLLTSKVTPMPKANNTEALVYLGGIETGGWRLENRVKEKGLVKNPPLKYALIIILTSTLQTHAGHK